MDFQEVNTMFHQEYIVMTEYRMMQTENIPGIYVIPSYNDSLYWFGVIFVRSGMYEGGVFRFTLTLPEKFPDSEVPVVKFTSQLYHPAVDSSSGILNLSEVFPHWDRKLNHIWQILKYVHWVFHNLNFKSPSNVDASVLWKTNKKLFAEKVKDCVISSIDHIYDDPPVDDKHYIVFQPYDPSIHENAKNQMLNPTIEKDTTAQGISWVKPGSYKPFSKLETE